ncbi:MAG: hypothetical protein D3923_16940 [Candidatus Electrothrix sp. AR3]|nr:hypothetical protein [Candidatus Electrothrix sp. AR3]
MMNEKDKVSPELSTQHLEFSIRIPAIRFEGFEGEWEEKEMSDCSSKIGDGLHGTPKYVDDSGIFFINGNNLISGSIFITNDTKQVHKKDQAENDKGLGLNTILMSINGTIGNLAWYRGEEVMLVLRPKSSDMQSGNLKSMMTRLALNLFNAVKIRYIN